MENGLTNLSEKKWDKVSQIIRQPLDESFYERSTLEVARDLLGKVLLVKQDLSESSKLQPSVQSSPKPRTSSWELAGQTSQPKGVSWIGGRIVEVEAYFGEDAASHSAKGPTPRSSVMFDRPAVAYVYFIYGMYEMLNFVTEREGFAGAVLIRALEPLIGVSDMGQGQDRLESVDGRIRKKDSSSFSMRGPGKLCRTLGVRRDWNRQSLQGPLIYVGDDGVVPRQIAQTPRVGISKARDKMWRFIISDSPWVCQVRENQSQRPVEKSSSEGVKTPKSKQIQSVRRRANTVDQNSEQAGGI